jgi:acetyltransferase-like isoleucine patch superfamily enzyme
MELKNFYSLKPGTSIDGDWFKGTIPMNIQVGEHTVLDSSHCFQNYHSQLEVGLMVGSYTTFWRTALAVEEFGKLEIGSHCFFSNASIVCSEKISIGNRVFIAGGVTIADSDFHPVDPLERLKDVIALSPVGNRLKRALVEKLPVIIEDDVWIGMNSTILKGVTIGQGAVVEPGSVVLKNVLPGQKVSGNPAKEMV